jgi:sec-independent protein translocase protein TatA
MLQDLSLGHILIILLIVMLVFGSKRLPELGASMGKSIREFKKGMNEVRESLDAPDPAPPPTSLREADSAAREWEPKKLSE